MAYALGAVKPFVQDVADAVGGMFNPAAIYGWRATAYDMTGHPAGLALDISVGDDTAKGQAIADYLEANASRLEIRYLIWRQRIWYPGKEWRTMETRTGAGDVNHMRHVHASFLPVVGDGRRLGGGLPDPGKAGGKDGGTSPIGGLADAITAPARLAANLTDPRLWIRVSQIIGGLVLMVGGAVIIAGDASEPVVKAAVGLKTGGGKAAAAAGVSTKTASTVSKATAAPGPS